MRKDEPNVIIYKILLYLYAVFKGEEVFMPEKYAKAIGKTDISEDYLIRIYRMMQKDGLIEGLTIERAWGETYILLSEESDMTITKEGLDYLIENNKMQEVGHRLIDAVDAIAGLIVKVGLDGFR